MNLGVVLLLRSLAPIYGSAGWTPMFAISTGPYPAVQNVVGEIWAAQRRLPEAIFVPSHHLWPLIEYCSPYLRQDHTDVKETYVALRFKFLFYNDSEGRRLPEIII